VEPRLEKIRNAVVSMFKVNLGLKDGERILVATDVPDRRWWDVWSMEHLLDVLRRALLARAVRDIAAEAFPKCDVKFYAYPCTGSHGAEPKPEVAKALRSADVVVAITTYSLSHTKAREEATNAGVRLASMPGFTEDMFYPGGPMSADYHAISRESKRLADLLTKAREAYVISPAGTEMRFSLEGRSGMVDDGLLDKPGAWGNLPAGEAFRAPREGTAEGKIVVEKGWYPELEEDMTLIFDGGEVIEVDGGGDVGNWLRKTLRPGVRREPFTSRRNLAELGLGTNPNAKNPLNILESEKIRGTVHLAVGDNAHIGGRVSTDLHIDFVIPRPTLRLDGMAVIQDGKIVIEP